MQDRAAQDGATPGGAVPDRGGCDAGQDDTGWHGAGRGGGGRRDHRPRARRPLLLLGLGAILSLAACQGMPPAGDVSPLSTSVGTQAPPASTGAPPEFWSPEPGAAWQWQLTVPVDQSVDVPVYDIDLFDNDKSVIDQLHAKGRKVICYFDAGAWESYRPDAAKFPTSVIGTSSGWENEYWLDIRQIDILAPLIGARLDMAVAKGCDAVEPDQDNGWENDPGFPITREESIRWNRWVAEAAHARGLSVGLKNSVTETAELEPYFDWNLNEECFEFDECELLLPFIRAGKTVLQVEYATETSAFCAAARQLGFSSMKKNLDLDAFRAPC